MTIFEQLITLISVNTDAGIRIYPLTAPDGVQKPYLTYQRIAFNDENVLSGSSGLTNTRMQIDAYAGTYLAADALAKQVSVLMAGWSVQNVSIQSQDLYEDAVKLFRVQTDYSIWH
ncbi:MAG: hypothetical protein JWQ10_3804 [Herbaspirillum sp.]|nr:hypothetical protein [Herbaspirillum sp.]